MEAFVFGPLQTKWLESLETNGRRQGRLRLGDKQLNGEYKACCLGEAGLISGVCEWVGDGGGILTVKKEYVPDSSIAMMGSPIHDLAGTSYQVMGFRDAHGGANDGTDTLEELNDKSLSWSHIAKIIRHDPTKFLTKSA